MEWYGNNVNADAIISVELEYGIGDFGVIASPMLKKEMELFNFALLIGLIPLLIYLKTNN